MTRESRTSDRDSFASNISCHGRIAALALIAVLSACTVTQRESIVPRDLSTLTDWQASGRIAVTGRDSGGSGSFTWVQHGAQTQVQMHGPIGIGGLRLTMSDQAMRIETADGRAFEAEDAQAELAARLGAQVPAQNLRYWLVGRAAPGDHEWSNTAETATLLQQDWRIDYQRFGISGGARLPLKLVAVSGPAKVRILIDRWKVK